MKRPKTKRGAERQFHSILNQIYKELKGGTLYGVDMPTIAVLFPDRYMEILKLKAIYSQLPA